MDRLLAALTSAQLTEWLAYAELEPFGPLREDYRAGLITATVANCALGRSKGAKFLKPDDLFETLKVPTKRQGWQTMKRELQRMTAAMGGGKPGKKPAKPESKPPARLPAKNPVKTSVKSPVKPPVRPRAGKAAQKK